MRTPNGDLLLARDYLENVAGSNAEEVGRASELLKAVKASMQVKALGEISTTGRDDDSIVENGPERTG